MTADDFAIEEFAREIICALEEKARGAYYAYAELASNIQKNPAENTGESTTQMTERHLREERAYGIYEGFVDAAETVEHIWRCR